MEPSREVRRREDCGVILVRPLDTSSVFAHYSATDLLLQGEVDVYCESSFPFTKMRKSKNIHSRI